MPSTEKQARVRELPPTRRHQPRSADLRRDSTRGAESSSRCLKYTSSAPPPSALSESRASAAAAAGLVAAGEGGEAAAADVAAVAGGGGGIGVRRGVKSEGGSSPLSISR